MKTVNYLYNINSCTYRCVSFVFVGIFFLKNHHYCFREILWVDIFLENVWFTFIKESLMPNPISSKQDIEICILHTYMTYNYRSLKPGPHITWLWCLLWSSTTLNVHNMIFFWMILVDYYMPIICKLKKNCRYEVRILRYYVTFRYNKVRLKFLKFVFHFALVDHTNKSYVFS